MFFLLCRSFGNLLITCWYKAVSNKINIVKSDLVVCMLALGTCTCQVDQLSEMLQWGMHGMEREVMGVHNDKLTSKPHAVVVKLVQQQTNGASRLNRVT